ncbi:MAG: MlaD family protein [Planctomycetes bacterium]|nr:MlaD family protein [Planctomycetota bacterium]
MAGRKQTATMELAIGATIIAAIIVLIVMLMAWGNSSSFLGRHYRVVVNMANVGGLKEGAPVKLGGYQIGRVASIQIRQGGTDMEIVLDIDENMLLPKGSTAKVSTAGLVGDAFMEIIPGHSSETIHRAATGADAERLQSSPLPDLSEMFAKVDAFGTELIVLTQNLNDVVGNEEFRRSLKDLAVNLNALSLQANQVMQRGQNVVGSIETAAQNVVSLTDVLKLSVEDVKRDLEQVTDKVMQFADKANTTMDNLDGGITQVRNAVGDIGGQVNEKIEVLTDDLRLSISDLRSELKETIGEIGGEVKTSVSALTVDARKAITNLDGGIDEIRGAVGKTIGDPTVQTNLTTTIQNLSDISASIAARRESVDKTLGNLEFITGDFRESGTRIRSITDSIEPQAVAAALATMTGTLETLGEVVEKIRADPVLALSVNKAADRIVKMKFDEMSKQGHYRTADGALDEINRWVREAMQRGSFIDPAYRHDRRPYVVE